MKKLDELIKNLREKQGSNLYSVVIFGSKANYGLEKIKSNVDLMIILENVTLDNLIKIRPYIIKWVKSKNRYPVILSKEEFDNTKDVFAVEFLDMQWNYQVVYGKNIFENFNIKYNDLKSQCIRDLKSLIFKFRNHYVLNINSKPEVKKGLVKLISKLLVIFRMILRLQNEQPSVFKKDLIDQFARIVPIDKKLFKYLVEQKEGTYDIPNYAVDDYAYLILNEVTKILKQIVSM